MKSDLLLGLGWLALAVWNLLPPHGPLWIEALAASLAGFCLASWLCNRRTMAMLTAMIDELTATIDQLQRRSDDSK